LPFSLAASAMVRSASTEKMAFPMGALIVLISIDVRGSLAARPC
jgi:hypothetical protein